MEQCEVDEKSNRQIRCTYEFFGSSTLALAIFWRNFDPQDDVHDDSPKYKNDRQGKIYALIHFVGPSDLVLRASRVLY